MPTKTRDEVQAMFVKRGIIVWNIFQYSKYFGGGRLILGWIAKHIVLSPSS